MSYEVVFDVVESGYTSYAPVLGLVFVCLAVGLFRSRREISKFSVWRSRPAIANALAYVGLGFSVLWTAVVLTLTVTDYVTLRRALLEEEVYVTEGWVEEFEPFPYRGRGERFTVCGVPFSYSDSESKAGFDQSKNHGEPLRNGLWVRISHAGERIARLEIAKDVPLPTACRTSSVGAVKDSKPALPGRERRPDRSL